MKEEKILTLTINPGPPKDIINGKKVEEYRAVSLHYFQLFCKKRTEGEFKGKYQVETPDDYKEINKIKLRNGYSNDRPYIIVEVKMIRIDEFINFIPEGMKKHDIRFTLYLGKILQSGFLEKLK